MHRGHRARWALAFLIVIAAVGLTACGSSDSDTDGTESAAAGATAEGGSESAVQAEATKDLQKYLKIPTEVSWITEKLPKPPPTGKEVNVMDCGAPACTAWANSVGEAAKALGWKAKRITQGVTPTQITAAWNQTARELPDAVFTIGIPKVLFTKQLATLKKNGIPVLNAAVNEGAGEGQVLSLSSDAYSAEVGEAWADWVISKEGEEANVLAVTSPEFPVTEGFREAFEAKFSEYCPSCEVTEVQVSAAQVGSGQNATQIIAALRSNPDVNYIVANDNIATGLPQAMISAGLDTPLIGQLNEGSSMQMLQEENPVYKAAVAYTPYENGWQMVDWAARFFADASTEPSEKQQPSFIVTPETVNPDETNYYPYIPNWDKEFEALWGVG